MENNIVKVSLWGQTVGEIYWDEKRKQSCLTCIKVFPSFLQTPCQITGAKG